MSRPSLEGLMAPYKGTPTRRMGALQQGSRKKVERLPRGLLRKEEELEGPEASKGPEALEQPGEPEGLEASKGPEALEQP